MNCAQETGRRQWLKCVVLWQCVAGRMRVHTLKGFLWPNQPAPLWHHPRLVCPTTCHLSLQVGHVPGQAARPLRTHCHPGRQQEHPTLSSGYVQGCQKRAGSGALPEPVMHAAAATSQLGLGRASNLTVLHPFITVYTFVLFLRLPVSASACKTSA